jgi:phosphatidylglycerol:prolipoprotein diacylglycerol transferase
MLPFVRIGPVLLQTPGLALLAGLWVAMTLIERESLRLKLNSGAILNMVFYGLVGGIIGARLIYAAQHPSIYLASPLGLLSLSASSLEPIAGLIIGVVIAFFIGRRQHLPLGLTLDALAPGLAVFMIAIGVANILSGNSYGSPSHLPWAIYLWGEYRHPTQVYETLAAIIIFVIWKITSTESRRPGMSFLQVVALSAGARIFLEAFHGASRILPGGFRVAQVIGLIILALAIYLASKWGKPELASSEREPTAPA